MRGLVPIPVQDLCRALWIVDVDLTSFQIHSEELQKTRIDCVVYLIADLVVQFWKKEKTSLVFGGHHILTLNLIHQMVEVHCWTRPFHRIGGLSTITTEAGGLLIVVLGFSTQMDSAGHPLA